MPDLTEFHELTELEELRAANGRLQTQLRRATAKTADLVAAVRQGAHDAALTLGNPPPVAAPPRDRRKAKPEVALLHLSDWQVGKVNDSYSPQVAGERVDRIAGKLAELAAIERADHPVREAHVLLGGDLIEGVGIFPGQAFEVSSGLFEQVFVASAAAERLIRFALSAFERVEVWAQTGNHGRLGRKGDHPREDNADTMVHALVRERVAEHERSGRLVWHPRESWYTIVQIGSYRALHVHGDQIKSFGGNLPSYGIYRKANAWASGVLPEFTDVYMEHFHQPLVIPMAHGRGRVFVNPSLESGNQYAAEFVAASGTPGQRLNFIEPGKGRVTSERVLWVD